MHNIYPSQKIYMSISNNINNQLKQVNKEKLSYISQVSLANLAVINNKTLFNSSMIGRISSAKSGCGSCGRH